MNLPGVRLTSMAEALAPASFLIFAISAFETVLSAVTTTVSVFLSTYQAVPATSADFDRVAHLGQRRGAEGLGGALGRWRRPPDGESRHGRETGRGSDQPSAARNGARDPH